MALMACVGFRTKPRKPYHPLTKVKVERPVSYVNCNYAASRKFYDAPDLNAQTLEWCARQFGRYRSRLRTRRGARREAHAHRGEVIRTEELTICLCPRRRASFDGFVNYEERRYGVPYWFPARRAV